MKLIPLSFKVKTAAGMPKAPEGQDQPVQEITVDVNVREGESLPECIEFAGGDENARLALNWLARSRCKSRITSTAGNATPETELVKLAEQFDKFASTAAASAGRTGPTNTSAIAFKDAVAALSAEEKTPEAIFALAQSMGIV